jgi:hypothetical protein
LVSEPKFPMRLILAIVCILAPRKSFRHFFYCMFIIVFSNKHWKFSSFCQLAKLLFLWGYFYLNTTFLSIGLWVVITKTMFIVMSSFLGGTSGLFPKHHIGYILTKTIVDFMFNKTTNEALVNDGTRFVMWMTSFVTNFISCTTTNLDRNFICYYPFFVFKFVVLIA